MINRKNIRSSTSLGALCVSAMMAFPAAAQDNAAANEGSSANTIMVTATRQSESLADVPISISAYTPETIEKQSLREIEDVVRLTPGVSVRRSGLGINNVSIRGVSSGAGASTIGVYIDDTPIQVRSLGVASSVMYPALFDLERVEILRGPQGTLFGAGSEGGTIRFIQPQPDLVEWSGRARGEVATTLNGSPSYETAFAVGGPIVEDKIGMRASVFFRHDGGFIDKVTGTPTVLAADGSEGADSVAFSNVSIYNEDANWTDTVAARLALKFAPTETITITPSFNYQNRYTPDVAPAPWPVLSDFETGDYAIPQWTPTLDENHIPLDVPKGEPRKDEFYLPALNIELDFGFGSLISTTSYFSRDMSQTLNYSAIYARAYAGRPLPGPGDVAISTVDNTQRNFTQELRLQSNTDGPLTWVIGGFYSRNKQTAEQLSQTNFLPLLPTVFGAQNDGPPFGPGYSAFVNFYGQEQLNGTGSYYSNFKAVDEQIAGFGELSYEVVPGLELTAGLRVSGNSVEYTAFYDGPANNLNAPRGSSCLPGTGTGSVPCDPVTVGEYAPGEGPYAPVYLNSTSSGSDTAVTPKFGVKYEVNPDAMVYATVSKGFRPSGAQIALPGNCNAELVALGYVNDQGQAQSPQTYGADYVWSYEVGGKFAVGRALNFSGSAFYIDWQDIQSTVPVSSCLQSLVDNLGSASSKGFDVQAQLQVARGLNLGAAVGYADTSFSEDIVINGRKLYTEGSVLPSSGSPWTVTLTADYEFPINNRDFYLHADYAYQGEERRTGSTDPDSFSFDPYQPVTQSYSIVNARAGVYLGDLELSVFATNLFNETPMIGLGHTRNNPIFTSFVLRPRTMGASASFRF